MRRIELGLASVHDLHKVEDAVRSLRSLMPQIKLEFVTDSDGRTVHFTCTSVDTLTLSSAMVMLRALLDDLGQVKVV